MIDVSCFKCHGGFKTYPSRVVKGRPVFCSKECFYSYRKGSLPWNTGKKCKSLSDSKRGDKNPRWKGGYDKKRSDHEYYIKNKKRLYLYRREWAKRNKSRVRASNSKWSKNNRDIRNKNWNKRRARLIANGGSFTDKEWKALKKEHEYKCAICKKRRKLTIDHKIPVSRWNDWISGRSIKYRCNDIENIQPLCRECNSRKNNTIR